MTYSPIESNVDNGHVPTFPRTSTLEKPEGKAWSIHTDSQGYTRKVYKTVDGKVFVEKTIAEEAATRFGEERGAILNFEELFFLHYAQVGSSIKASYEQIAEELKKNVSGKEETINQNLQIKLAIIDFTLQQFLNRVSARATHIFDQKLRAATQKDAPINISELNKLLDDEIKNLKDELDKAFEKAFNDKNIICYSSAREETNAFNADTVFETRTPQRDGSIFIERIESTKITAHDKEHGPAISKVSISVIKAGESIPITLYNAHRTSHLVSQPVKISKTPYKIGILSVLTTIAAIGVAAACAFPPVAIALAATAVTLLGVAAYLNYKEQKKNNEALKASQEKTKQTIAAYMKNRDIQDKPMIYNLLTSTHANEKGVVGIDDHFKNQQTQRLRTLIKAQHAYNRVNNIKDMFFTLNTPTNTFGREISLNNCSRDDDPEMHQVAQSNLIALGIMLFGKDNEHVQQMVSNYLLNNDSYFEKKYRKLQNQALQAFAEIESKNGSATGENELTLKQKHAKKFLLQRFIDDTAAHHQYAKETATYIGVLSEEKNANLIVGCKSGNERTGGILGRIATMLSSTFNFAGTENYELDKDYNERGCFATSAVAVSEMDQASLPKTGTKKGGVVNLNSLNTNRVEAIEMTNISTDNADKLQVHKEKFSLFKSKHKNLKADKEKISQELTSTLSYK